MMLMSCTAPEGLTRKSSPVRDRLHLPDICEPALLVNVLPPQCLYRGQEVVWKAFAAVIRGWDIFLQCDVLAC